MAESSGLNEFEKVAKTYRAWSKEILNAFKYTHITNGPVSYTHLFLKMKGIG